MKKAYKEILEIREWAVGQPSQLVEWATCLLVAGKESNALVLLAGLTKSEYPEATNLMKRALAELNYNVDVLPIEPGNEPLAGGMNLITSSSKAFSLKIIGYEFPNADENWLMIQINVKTPVGSWTAINPSLQITEVEHLISWLEGIDIKNPTKTEIVFFEPNLSFEVLKDRDGVWLLRIIFALEALPNWLPPEKIDRPIFLDFVLEEIDFSKAAFQLKNNFIKIINNQ